MSDFKAYPAATLLEAQAPDGSLQYLRVDAATNLQVTSEPLLALLGEILVVMKKIETHLGLLNGETLQDSDVR
jgi:hypothetical protein